MTSTFLIFLLVGFVSLTSTGCKDRGTVIVSVEVPDSCEPATHIASYLIRGAVCDDCRCSQCLTRCSADNCQLGCQGDYCTLPEFQQGIEILPEEAGVYAIVYQLVRIGEDGAATEVAVACADELELAADGTTSYDMEIQAECCP